MITFRAASRGLLGMARSRLHTGATALALCSLVSALPAWADNLLDKTIHVDIPANMSLEEALIEWGSQAGMSVMINTSTVEHRVAPALHGTLSAGKALTLLLQGSGMSYSEEKGRVRIIPTPLVRSGLWDVSSDINIASDANPRTESSSAEEDTYRSTPPINSDVGSSNKTLSEVVVTAEKRLERLQDVPVPVTEIEASTLVEAHQFRIQDYFATVPGLSMNSYGDGSAQLAIRGVTTAGNTNPTVAVLIDDIPVSGSSAVTDNASYIPDIDPSDLSSVEVLRGPQGTLYGAASLGGLLKYVTADPSTDRFGGRIQADFSRTYNGDGLGYGVRGSLNLPVTDTFAIRVSAFNRVDAGWINDAALNSDGVNRDHADGGRVSVMWKPSDSFSVKLAAMAQETLADNVSEVEPQLGNLQQDFIRGSGPLSTHFHLYEATIKAKFAGLDFTSVTGYSTNADDQFSDFSIYGLGNALLYNESKTEKFTQEFRLSSSAGKVFDWLVGGFFNHEYTPVIQQIYTVDDTGLPIPGGQLIQFDFPLSISDYAVFADTTIHFTDQFDLQIGGRESHNKQIFNETDTGPDVPLFDVVNGVGLNSPAILKTVRTTDNSFTYLATPEFKFSPDLMVYARAASGYRPGGPNSNAALQPTALPTFGPDKTQNFEVGLKGDLLDHRLVLDSSVYYIKWQNIQIQVSNNYSASFFTNGGDAKSEGIEFSQQLRPVSGLTISAWEAWNEAILTSAFPNDSQIHGSFGEPGDRLPYSPRWSGNLSINQEFPLPGTLTGYVRASAAYVGQRVGNFFYSPTQPRIILGGYVEPNFLAGVRSGNWSIDVFAKNFTDRRGETFASTFGNYNEYTYIQPRTVGLSLAYSF